MIAKNQNIINLLKECMIDLLQNDWEVRNALFETLQTPIPPKPHIDYSDPTNPTLWDELVLLAQNKINKVSFNGKKVVVPNHEIGYKSPEMIKEWASKAYTKLGASWDKKNKHNPSNGLLMQEMYTPARSDGGMDRISDFFGAMAFKDGNSVVSMADIARDSMRTVQDQANHGHNNSITEVMSYGDYDSQEESYSNEERDELRINNIPKSEEAVAGGYNNWAKLAFFDQ